MQVVPNKPKVIIAAPFPREDDQSLQEYVFSLIKFYKEKSDDRSCAELYHFLVQVFELCYTGNEPDIIDEIGVDIQFENKTVAELKEIDKKEFNNADSTEFCGYLQNSVEMLLQQQDFARIYQILHFYSSVFDLLSTIPDPEDLKIAQNITDSILKTIGEDQKAYHLKQLAKFRSKIVSQFVFAENIAALKVEDRADIMQIFQPVHDLYHDAIKFYEAKENYAEMANIYLDLAMFACTFKDLEMEEFKKDKWYDDIKTIMGEKKVIEYFETATNICLVRNCTPELERAIKFFKEKFSILKQWHHKISKGLFAIEEIKPGFAEKLLLEFYKCFLFTTYKPAEFMSKLLFVFEKFANAALNWAEIKSHQNLSVFIKTLARNYYKENPEAACLINAIGALFTWGESKEIFLLQSKESLSFEDLLYFKAQQYKLINITPLSGYNTVKSMNDAKTFMLTKENFKSFEIYCSIERDLISYNNFILQTHSSVPKIEIKLFAVLTRLVTKIFKQLPIFVKTHPGNKKTLYTIIDKQVEAMLLNQAEKLSHLATAVDFLKMECVTKFDFAIELGKTKGQLTAMQNRVLSLEEQVEQFSEAQGERNFAKEGIFGEEKAKEKNLKQSTLDGFFKKSRVEDSTKKPPVEEPSSGFGPSS